MARHDPDSYEEQQFRATAGTDNLDEYLKAKGHPGMPRRSWPKMSCDKAWDRIVQDRQLSKNEPEGLANTTPRPAKRSSDEPTDQLTVKQWNQLHAQRLAAQRNQKIEQRTISWDIQGEKSPPSSVKEKVKALIALELDEDYERVTSEFSLFHYLDEDSTMYCEFPNLFFSMEEVFGFSVPLDDENLYTVGDIAEYIEKKQKE